MENCNHYKSIPMKQYLISFADADADSSPDGFNNTSSCFYFSATAFKVLWLSIIINYQSL